MVKNLGEAVRYNLKLVLGWYPELFQKLKETEKGIRKKVQKSPKVMFESPTELGLYLHGPTTSV